MKQSSTRVYRRPPIHTEDPDKYSAGGFAPIYLGDVLKDRYHIFRKIGCGAQSTVWLAQDRTAKQHVALKVHLARLEDREPVLAHHFNLARQLDHFTLKSVYGTHICTVLEVLGRTLRTLIDNKLDVDPAFGKTRSDDDFDEYYPHIWSMKLAREICRQIMLGVDALHSQRMAHRDIQPGNIAFALSFDINDRSLEEVQGDGVWSDNSSESEGSGTWGEKNVRASKDFISSVERVDGQALGASEIKYVVGPALVHDRLVFDAFPAFRLTLFDFGFSRPFEKCDQPLKQPPNYRPPEAILPMPVTHKADIFSAALVLWETVMTRNFVWSHWIDGELDNISYLRDLANRIGPLPERFSKAYPTDSTEEEELDEEDLAYGSMRVAAQRDGPKDMTNGEMKDFVDLMSGMMRWEPEGRLSAKEVLEHPFLVSTSPYGR